MRCIRGCGGRASRKPGGCHRGCRGPPRRNSRRRACRKKEPGKAGRVIADAWRHDLLSIHLGVEGIAVREHDIGVRGKDRKVARRAIPVAGGDGHDNVFLGIDVGLGCAVCMEPAADELGTPAFMVGGGRKRGEGACQHDLLVVDSACICLCKGGELRVHICLPVRFPLGGPIVAEGSFSAS